MCNTPASPVPREHAQNVGSPAQFQENRVRPEHFGVTYSPFRSLSDEESQSERGLRVLKTVLQLFASLTSDEGVLSFCGSTDSENHSYSAKQTFTNAADSVELFFGSR